MAHNKAVTRTISVGAIVHGGSKTSAPSENPLALRRHSSAGLRALLWATSGAKSLGGSPGPELQTSRDNIFPSFLTPDSIPRFTIPSLSVQAGGSRAPAASTRNRQSEEEGREDGGEGPHHDNEGLGADLAPSLGAPWSSSSSDLTVPPPDRRAQRTLSDPLKKGPLKRERSYAGPYCYHMDDVHQHCLDPASKAALSLPHLAKVTTPYGFVTLSQSPQMADEEALLRSARRGGEGPPSRCATAAAAAKTPVTRTRRGTPGIRGNSLHGGPPLAFQRLSQHAAVCRQTEITASEGDCHHGDNDDAVVVTATHVSSPKQPSSNRKPKRRLYEVIRKHLMALH